VNVLYAAAAEAYTSQMKEVQHARTYLQSFKTSDEEIAKAQHLKRGIVAIFQILLKKMIGMAHPSVKSKMDRPDRYPTGRQFSNSLQNQDLQGIHRVLFLYYGNGTLTVILEFLLKFGHCATRDDPHQLISQVQTFVSDMSRAGVLGEHPQSPELWTLACILVNSRNPETHRLLKERVFEGCSKNMTYPELLTDLYTYVKFKWTPSVSHGSKDKDASGSNSGGYKGSNYKANAAGTQSAHQAEEASAVTPQAPPVSSVPAITSITWHSIKNAAGQDVFVNKKLTALFKKGVEVPRSQNILQKIHSARHPDGRVVGYSATKAQCTPCLHEPKCYKDGQCNSCTMFGHSSRHCLQEK
jgi:hypothetical protein